MIKKLGLLFLVSCFCFTTLSSYAVNALGGGDWQAGRIIDNSVFTDKNSLSVAQIQDFLNQKVGTGGNGRVAGQCDTNGTATSELGGGTRAQYGAAHGNPAPFTCLKDYYEVPKRDPGPGIPASNYGGAAIPAGAESAAQLIWDAAQTYNISPKVLLVTIQKESAGPLITDDWPFKSQYTYAMGAHCPDTAACDQNYAGFSIQIAESAGLLRYYLDNMSQPWWTLKKPGNNTILYNPNAACGSSNVFIQSQATAALYTYTPYQPNQAALNNVYGTGDDCSAYGNRNFWRLFNDWFGPTTSDSTYNILSFIRLNHSSGNAELIGYSSLSNYSIVARNDLTNYPAVAPDGAVVPLYRPNGDLSFIRLNHSSGNVEEVSYSASSGYKEITSHEITGYPAVAPDGAVVPLYRPNGDLSFIRLNHSSGNVEEVSYSGQSGYKQITSYEITGYPDVAPDGAVIPLYRPNGDLTFVRLNHSSGNVEEVSYSGQSGYRQITSHELTGYPAVAPDGAVVPLYRQDGPLSFIRLNHSSGNVEVVTYSGQSGYRQIVDHELTGYPAVAPDGAVVPLYMR